jgi:phenylalanyl-tRNA synthetase beta chain
LNRDVTDARLFEMGSLYRVTGGEREEPRYLCLGATATAVRAALSASARLDGSKGEHAAAGEAFRSFKGDVENLLSLFSADVAYERGTAEYLHPGRSARAVIKGEVVAQFGQVHPEIVAARKLRQDIFLAGFDVECLYRLGLRPIRFTPLGKYPAVERDFSFIFDDGVTFQQMHEAVAGAGISELRDFRPAEIFRGGSIASGSYSVLLRAQFQSAERTLREDEIAAWSGKIVAALTALGGTQRV